MATMHRVKLLLTGDGIPQGGVATHYFDYASSGAQSAADAALSLWDGFADIMSNRVTWTQDAIVSQIDSETGDVFGVSPITALSSSGVSSTDPVTQASQALIQWRTGVYLNSREVRGRTFIPGILETYSTNGELDAGIIAGKADEIQGFLDSSGVVPVVWHRPSPLGPGSQHVISSGALWHEFAVLRGRR